MTELKACPFCSGEPEVERQGSNRQSHIIVCRYCGARLESNEVWDAGSQWNRRSLTDALHHEIIEKGRKVLNSTLDEGMSQTDFIEWVMERLEGK